VLVIGRNDIAGNMSVNSQAAGELNIA